MLLVDPATHVEKTSPPILVCAVTVVSQPLMHIDDVRRAARAVTRNVTTDPK